MQNTHWREGRDRVPLAVLRPQDVPRLEEALAWATANFSPAEVQNDNPTDFLVHSILRESVLQIRCEDQPVEEQKEASDEAEHDAYFEVRRVQGDACAIFFRSILMARATLLEEAIVGEATAAPIDQALCDLLRCAAGHDSAITIPVQRWTATQQGQVLQRWIRGHHIFAVLTQGLIFSFQTLGRAIRAGNSEETILWADLCVSLFQGSAAAFEFTGAFGIDEYNASIRPTMMCPATPVNLSGLMSADHRYLAQQMRDMRPALKSMHQTHGANHQQLAHSLAAVYDSHIHVCERFVGVQPSLLTAGTTEKSGPALVAQFKSVRLKAFEHVQRAERIVPQAERQPQQAGCPHSKQQ